MDSTAQQGAALVECIAPLDDEDRRALRAYWEQVIREEWMPPVRPVPRAVSLAELDTRRERRAARRAVALIAAAGRVQVCGIGRDSGYDRQDEVA